MEEEKKKLSMPAFPSLTFLDLRENFVSCGEGIGAAFPLLKELRMSVSFRGVESHTFPRSTVFESGLW